MKLTFLPSVLALVCALTATPLAAQQPAADPYEALAKWQFGQSRLPLAQIEEQIRKTAAADYGAIESRLLPILQSPETPKDAKRYICRWLGIVGSAKCVPAVAECLTDEDLAHPARMALEPMAVPAAGAALRAALPKVKGKLLVGLIGSIGVRRDPAAAEALSGLAADNDAPVAAAAIAALGQIATEQAAAALDALRVPESRARTLARARLAAAAHLAKAGQSAPAIAVFRSLMQPAQPGAIRIAALKGLIGALPQADAARLVMDMIQGEDAAMRSATVAAYVSSPDQGLKDQVAQELPSMKPAGQLVLLGVLADQPEVAARAGVLAALKAATDDPIRAAALECLARHGEAADVMLVASLAADKAPAVAAAARKTLLRMGKPGVDDALVRLIESPHPEERAVALATLANRRVETALPTLARLVGGNDTGLAMEAAKALGVMGKADQLKDLAKVVASTNNGALRNAADEAIKSICRRTADKQAAAGTLLSALDQAAGIPGRVALLQALAYTGGETALSAVLKAMQDEKPEIRAAATRALVNWPDAAAGPKLVELARTTPDASQAIVALRDGCLRLAEMDELPLAQRVSILRGVVDVAKRPEEKKRAIADLAEMPIPASMELLQTCAREAALQADAIQAAVRLSRQLGVVYGPQTLAALEQLRTQASTEELRGQVETALKAARNVGQSPDGFIIAWLCSGPYVEEGKDGGALFDIDFAPEKAGARPEWRPLTASKSGLVEFDKGPMRGDNRVAYLKTRITSGKDQEALLEMGSDDGIKVWLNGKVVYANNTVRPCTPGSDKARIKLKPGANELLVKVTQGGGEWAACCKLRAANGQAIEDVTVAPSAE